MMTTSKDGGQGIEGKASMEVGGPKLFSTDVDIEILNILNI